MSEEINSDLFEDSYDVNSSVELPPLPVNNNKMVHQLDNVKKESEEKANEIFDMLEEINLSVEDMSLKINEIKGVTKSNVEIFSKLKDHFPKVESFRFAYIENKNLKDNIENANEICEDISLKLMDIMNAMQYQDIHKQKIERVVNVMRSLSNYINSIFESSISDSERTSSAKYISGDSTKGKDVVSNDDIESLLESFSKGNENN